MLLRLAFLLKRSPTVVQRCSSSENQRYPQLTSHEMDDGSTSCPIVVGERNIVIQFGREI